MAIIKKFSPFQNLTNFETFIKDTASNSDYFRITQLNETLTGGKNAFLIEGSEFLKETTEVKIEILDVAGNPIYFEPGDGIPEYYEGTSKLISVHVYDDTPIGNGKITILGELKNYVNSNGAVVPIPEEWKGVYNVKWERSLQINKNLANETIVRFYKRPQVTITELIKPIFSKTIPTVTDTGYVHGVSEIPSSGTDLSNWRTGAIYKLIRTSGSWDRDVDENIITITNPTHTARIVEVLNDSEVLVNTPYTIDNLVSNFTSGSYSVTYSDFQNEIIGESTLTGSFAKIDITQLKTFVGDVARVKVFRKSRNAVGDFQFVQESKLESTELLRDITTPSNTEIPYGRFDETNLSTYWITSSNDHPTTIDSSILSQAVKVDYGGTGTQQLITSQSFSLSKDVEYTLNFRTLLSGSITSGKTLRAYFSGSTFTQDFLTISGSSIYTTRQRVSQNILSENTGDAKLVFEFTGDDWYLSNVSLKNAQDTSFSPDEFTLIQDIPRKLASETFDFRFEFYDINNNYIPVDVTAVGVFDGGNDFPTSGKLLTFESDRNAFRFSSGSIANPYNQVIKFSLTQNNLTGSLTFESSAFDVDGNYLEPSDYIQYPGLLSSVTPAGALLSLSNFTGSRVDGLYTPYVGSIVYTASLENLQEFETVYRLEDGDNAPQIIVTSNANQFIYEPTALEPKPTGQQITIRAQRKNLASLITPIEVNSGSNRPELTYVDTVGGIDTYTISATAFSSSFSQNNFDEVTYSFTGSDVFGNLQSDEITLSKVVNFDGVSITLSNESTTFRSNGKGVVLDDFEAGDGIVEVRIANKEIQHDDESGDGIQNPNTFDIVSAVATNVNEAYPSYLTNEYGIDSLTADSGSLVLNIKYLAGDGVSSQSFQKKVNYTKNRIAPPSLTLDTTNKTQNVDAKSTGVQLTSFDDSVITVREFYTGSVTSFATENVSILITSGTDDVNGNDLVTRSGLTLSFGTLPNNVNSTQVGIEVTVTDSEGESRTIVDTISLSKSLASAPNIEFQVTPSSQTLTSNSRGSGSLSPTSLTITANEGGSPRTLTDLEVTDETNGITTGTPVLATGVIPITSTASDMTSDSGVITIAASALNTEGTTIIRTVKATINRTRSAAPVVDVSISPITQVLAANSVGSGSISPETITVTALEAGVDKFTSIGTPTYSGGLSGTKSGNTITFTDTASDMTSDTETIIVPVNYTDSEGTTGTKNITATITRTRRAAPNTDIRALPSAQSILSSSAEYATPDNVLVYVSEGGDDYTYSTSALSGGISEANSFRITSQDGTNISSDEAGFGTISPPDITSDSGLNGTITLEYVNSEGVLFTNKVTRYDISVSKEGIDGNDAKIMRITSSGLTFVENASGVVSPDYITLTANKQNITDTVTWSTTPSVTLYTAATGGTTTTTGDVVYLRKGNFGSNTSVSISATADGESDSVTISRLVDGGNGITITNSNPSIILPADDYGEVSSYSDSGTLINVYEGATQLDYDGSGTTAGHWKITTSVSPTSAITVGTITDSTNTASVGVHSSMQDLTDRATITYNITGKKLNGDSFTNVTTQVVSKNKAPKPPLSDTAIKIESWDATPFDTSPGTTTVPTISAAHYGLFTTAGSAITSTALRKYNTVGYLSLDGNAVSSNNFSTNINTYLLKTAEVGDIVVLYSDENNYGNYTLAAKTKVAATGDTTIQLTHISSAGRLTPNNLTYVGFGRVLIGPGVVYRGEYDSDNAYYYSETRRDIVKGSNDSYYLASNTAKNGLTTWGDPTSTTDWEAFGAEFSSIATDVLFAQDVFANRTINIGSDGTNPVIALNSDYDGGNANPYIAIGAANYGGNGVWLGFDDGTAKTSFVNGTTSFMKWNGTSLEIKGSITVTGGDAATQTQAQGYATTAQTNAESYADGIVESLSISAMDLTLSSNMRITNGRELRKAAGTAWAEQVYSGVGFKDGAFVSFKNSTANTNAYYMFGLNSDPTTNASYTSIDYIWYVRQGSTYEIRVNGSAVTPDTTLPAVADGDVLAIFYDGSTVKWYRNNTLYNTVSAANGLNLYLDSSFSTTTTTPCISWFEFGPAGQTNSSNKTDGEVGGWTIDSSAIYSGTKVNNGSYTAAGAITIGSSGYISANKFRIDVNGNAYFKGDVTGANGNFAGKITAGNMVLGNDAGGAGVDGIHIDGNDYWYANGNFSFGNGGVTWNGTTLTISGNIESSDISGGSISGTALTGGSLNIPSAISAKFSVDSDGNMTAQDASIEGTVNIQQGSIGGWVVDSIEEGGVFRNEYDPSAPGTGSLVFDPVKPEIQGFKIDGNNVDKKISIHPENTWVSTGGGSVYISDMTNNGASYPWSIPSNRTSNSGNSTAVYNTTNQTESTQNIVVPQAGTYELTGLYKISSLTLNTPSTISAYSNYPTSNPQNEYDYWGTSWSPRRHLFKVDLVFRNISTNAETVVNVQTEYRYGAVNYSYYQAVNYGFGLQWSEVYGTSNAYGTTTSFTQVVKNVTLPAGTYRAKFRIGVGAQSGYVQQQTGQFTYGTPTYYTTTSSPSNIGYNSRNFYFIQPVNLVEMSSRGIQIINDANSYLQLTRTDSISGTAPQMIGMKGGTMKIYHLDYADAYASDLLLQVDGKVQASNLQVSYAFSSPNTSAVGLNGNLVPRYDNSVDLGNSSFRYDDIYATNTTIQSSDRKEKTNISGSILGLNFINNLNPVSYTWISGSSGRTHYGLIAQEVSESLAVCSVHTDDFGGFIQNDIYVSGSGTGSIEAAEVDIYKHEEELGTIDNWQYSYSKYGLRYSEFISPMIKAIQELSEKVSQLESQISGSL